MHGPDEQIELAQKAVTQGMSVRQVEREAQTSLGDLIEAPSMAKKKEDPNVRAAVDALESALKTRVRIVTTGDQKGRIEIDYYSVDELDRLYTLITEGKQ